MRYLLLIPCFLLLIFSQSGFQKTTKEDNLRLVIKKTMALDLQNKREAKKISVSQETKDSIRIQATCFRNIAQTINTSSIEGNDRFGFILASLIFLNTDAIGQSARDRSEWVEEKSRFLENRYQELLGLSKSSPARQVLLSIKLQARVARYYKNHAPGIDVCALWQEISSGEIEKVRLEIIFYDFLQKPEIKAWLNDTSMNLTFSKIYRAQQIMSPWIKNSNRLSQFPRNFTSDLFGERDYLSAKHQLTPSLRTLIEKWQGKSLNNQKG